MNTAPVIKEDGKGYRRTAVVLMALVFASLLLVSIAPASDAETNGECGTNLTWALTQNADSPGTYTLTISGTGTVMDDYTDVEYTLADSDVQFAFSIYGEFEVGDEVILICEAAAGADGNTTYRVIDYVEY